MHKTSISPYIAPGLSVNFDIMRSVVLSHFPEVNPDLLHTSTRKREYVMCRGTLMVLERIMTGTSQVKIGYKYGRDHATVLHGFSMIATLYKHDKPTRKLLDNIIDACLVDRGKFNEFLEYATSLSNRGAK